MQTRRPRKFNADPFRDSQKKALAMAAKGKQVERRWSKLKERLSVAGRESTVRSILCTTGAAEVAGAGD